MEACNTDQQICLPARKLPRVVIIGGGFAGIVQAKDYPEPVSGEMNIYLLEAGDQPLNEIYFKALQKTLKYMTKADVEVFPIYFN